MRTGLTACLATLLIGAAGASLRAQALGDVAKKEEERRKQVQSSGKVYTNKDLASLPPATAPTSTPAAPAAAGKAGDKPAGDDASKTEISDKTDKPEGADGAKKDQKFWAEKMKSLRESADRDQVMADAMQTRINALTHDVIARDDPAQKAVLEKDRQRAFAELDRLKKQVAATRKLIADTEEEARRAGVPPGWLR